MVGMPVGSQRVRDLCRESMKWLRGVAVAAEVVQYHSFGQRRPIKPRLP